MIKGSSFPWVSCSSANQNWQYSTGSRLACWRANRSSGRPASFNTSTTFTPRSAMSRAQPGCTENCVARLTLLPPSPHHRHDDLVVNAVAQPFANSHQQSRVLAPHIAGLGIRATYSLQYQVDDDLRLGKRSRFESLPGSGCHLLCQPLVSTVFRTAKHWLPH